MGEIAPERRMGLGHGGLQEPAITQARGASVDLELSRVDLDDVFDVEELQFVRAHFASFRGVSSWTAIIRFVDSRIRSFLPSLAGQMRSASPLVLTSSAVSLVMPSSSRIGRSLDLSLPQQGQHLHPRVTGGAPQRGCRGPPDAVAHRDDGRRVGDEELVGARAQPEQPPRRAQHTVSKAGRRSAWVPGGRLLDSLAAHSPRPSSVHPPPSCVMSQ
jgi:hypothetical protein